MISGIFFVCSCLVLLVMSGIHLLLRNESSGSMAECAPLESGFVSTGKIYILFSLQLFALLVLFLILDLEIVFVVSFLLGSSTSNILSFWLLFFILGSLWAEWQLGNLSWAL